MNILHLSASYSFTDLYKNLLTELDNREINQIMYVALKDLKHANKRMVDSPKNITYIYSAPFKRVDSYIYYTKILKVLKDIEKKVILKNVDLLHAHFLFSDGGVAYKLNKKYNTKYIVAVRNTDINTFFKYGIHVRRFGINILRNADKIIFLSPSYKELLLNKHIPTSVKKEINEKSIVIPNGIDRFWIENIYLNKPMKKDDKTINLIFVGELNENKNVMTSLYVFEELKKRGYQVTFDIVGKGELEEKITEWVQQTKNQKLITLHGYISNKDELLKLYRKSDIFIMPSYKETFGLVYIEAMSQGLPVIYTRGEGIDGYYEKGHVGYPSVPDSIQEMSDRVEEIIQNYNLISKKTLEESAKFNWSAISTRYINLYKSILNNREVK